MTIPQTQMPGADAVSRRVHEVVRSAAKLPAFAARLESANLSAEDIVDVDDLNALPIQTKDDVLAAQHAHPPFGGMLSDDADVARVFQSPGPLYEPQLTGCDPWRWSTALDAAGFSADDTVLNCFAYHLSPAGVMFDEAARALGARVFPGGIGSADLQARAISDLSITAYTGLPSYLNAIIERYQELELPPQRWKLARALVTAEPLPDSLRTQLSHWVDVVHMAYGTAETGLLGYEQAPGSGLVVPDDVLVQICDLDTGVPIDEGEGQIVVTLLRTHYPMIRFGTGDLSAWIDGPDGPHGPDGRRLAGVLGRVGQAVKVRGMFLHPAQATRVIGAVSGVDKFRLVVDRDGHRDWLRCEVVTSRADAQSVLTEVADRVRQELRFGCTVDHVDALPDDASTIADIRDWS